MAARKEKHCNFRVPDHTDHMDCGKPAIIEFPYDVKSKYHWSNGLRLCARHVRQQAKESQEKIASLQLKLNKERKCMEAIHEALEPIDEANRLRMWPGSKLSKMEDR